MLITIDRLCQEEISMATPSPGRVEPAHFDSSLKLILIY